MVVLEKKAIIDIKRLKNFLGGSWVHNGINLKINQGEIVAIIGGSGCGKTTLLRSILMLHTPTSGRINVFDTNVINCTRDEAVAVQRRWGVMFQSSALFSSMTVLENVMFPIGQFTSLTLKVQRDIALLKIVMSGLSADAANKYPSELSGGMKKRAALARAIVMDPHLVFLDEPTAGLDPQSAEALDNLVLSLRKSLGLTFVMVTHDLDTLWYVPDRVIFMGEGKILADTDMATMVEQPHPLIHAYFSGSRAMRLRQVSGGMD
jgi:phospholipid/cholesterol/gamma-HCH transport system ATP-binding protein